MKQKWFLNTLITFRNGLESFWSNFKKNQKKTSFLVTFWLWSRAADLQIGRNLEKSFIILAWPSLGAGGVRSTLLPQDLKIEIIWKIEKFSKMIKNQNFWTSLKSCLLKFSEAKMTFEHTYTLWNGLESFWSDFKKFQKIKIFINKSSFLATFWLWSRAVDLQIGRNFDKLSVTHVSKKTSCPLAWRFLDLWKCQFELLILPPWKIGVRPYDAPKEKRGRRVLRTSLNTCLALGWRFLDLWKSWLKVLTSTTLENWALKPHDAKERRGRREFRTIWCLQGERKESASQHKLPTDPVLPF